MKIALLLTLITIPGIGQTVTCSADVDRSLCKQISDMGPLFALSGNRNEPLRIQVLDPKAYEQAVQEVEKNCVLSLPGSKRPGCNLFAGGIYADSVHFITVGLQ